MNKSLRRNSDKNSFFYFKNKRYKLLIQLALFGVLIYFFIALAVPFKDKFLNLFFPKPASQAALLMNKEAEFYSNKLLIKVAKKSRGKFKVSKGNDTGLGSLNALMKKYKAVKIEQVATPSKTSDKGDDIFNWYLVTLDTQPKVAKGLLNKATKKIDPQDNQAKAVLAMADDFKSDPNIEAAEPDVFISDMQTSAPTPTPTSVGCLNAPQIYLANTSTTANPGQSFSNTLYYHNTNDPSCGSTATLGISYSYPSSWIVKPAQYSISVKGGDTVGVPISITVGSNATVGTYTYQFWVATFGPYNGTVQVTNNTVITPTPTFAPTSTPLASPTATITSSVSPTPTQAPVDNGVIPNDPYFSTSGSWGQPFDDQWGLKRLDVQHAWEQSTGSADLVIAVTDTGVDRNHEDLKDNMWVNTKEIPGNGIDDDGNGYVDDYYGWNMYSNNNNITDDGGHGTMVAGVIAAEGNNGIGISGVDWHAKIMPLKVLGSDGTGAWSAGAAAITYAANNGAKIINMSWGANAYSQIVEDAVRYAHSKGLVLVAAAGNDGVDMTDNTPAGNEQVISAGATDYYDARSFSYWSSDYGARLDVAAPGMDILTTKSSTATCLGYPQVGSSYCSIAGTSFSSPFTAGVVGLLLSKYPYLTNEQVRQILRASSVDLGILGPDIYYGYGRVNAAKAMELAATVTPLAPDINSPVGHSVVSGVQAFTGSAGGNNFANYTLEAGLGNYPSNWIKLASSSTPVSSGTLSSVDTSTLPAGTYTFRLTANTTDDKSYQFQTYGVSVNNQVVTPTPTPIVTPLPAPSNLSATPISTTQIQLKWNAVQGIGTYNLYRNGRLIMQGNVLSYTDNNLTPNTTYTYNIQSQDDSGNKSVLSGSVSATTFSTPTSSPTTGPTVSPTAAPTPTPTPIQYYTISGSVFVDTNNNGIKDVGESNYTGPSLLVSLDNGRTVSTDTSGNYALYKMLPGSYSESMTLPSNYVATTPDPITLSITDKNITQDFGINTAPTPTPTPDLTAPTVSLTSPVNGATLTGQVALNATASDNVGVTKVEFVIDGNVYDTVNNAPYTSSWDTTVLQAGSTHTLVAKAYDQAGNVGTSKQISVTIGDTTPPTVTITSPVNGTTVSDAVDITANATDNQSVQRVDFYVNGNLKESDLTSPYEYTWDSREVQNGTIGISATAYDTVGNRQTDAVDVTVANSDSTPPSAPTNVTATTTSFNTVDLTWTASSDNVGVIGYYIIRNGSTIAQTSTTSYTDSSVQPSTLYQYQIMAYDAAGNTSSASAIANVTTPQAPDTEAPTAPTNLTAVAVSASQINLTWDMSTDNIGVTGYEVFRNGTLITSVTGTSFGDTGLTASTSYTYTVKAVDAAGNLSTSSNSAVGTTQTLRTTGDIVGTVSSSAGGVISGASVMTYINGHKNTFTTNSSGQYGIFNIVPGTYTLKYSARNYSSFTDSASVTADKTTQKDVTLNVASGGSKKGGPSNSSVSNKK